MHLPLVLYADQRAVRSIALLHLLRLPVASSPQDPAIEIKCPGRTLGHQPREDIRLRETLFHLPIHSMHRSIT